MYEDITSFLREIWQYRPIIIVMLVGALIIFSLLVIDTHRHRKKQKQRHLKKH
jgi:hypothetical protein